MADICFDVDAALAEVPVNIYPLTDDTDFKTIENAIAYNAAGMALYWHFVTCAGAYTVTAVTPTTGGNYDWTDQGDAGIYTIEIPASGGASINNDTEGYGWFTGVCTGVLPWRGPVCEFRRAALNDLFVEGSTASTNMEDFFDGTGYAGGTAKLEVDVAKWLGTAPLTPLIAGVPLVMDRTAVRANTCQAGGTSYQVTLDASASSTDDFYKNMLITILTGTGAGQTRIISGYNGTTKVASTTPAWVSHPDATSTFVIERQNFVNVKQWNDGNVSTPTNSGIPIIEVGYVGSTAVTANNALIGVNVVSWKGSAAPAMTGDAYARLGAPIGASISADIQVIDDFVDTEIAAIKAVTDKFAFTGAGPYTVKADAVEISGDATAADALESQYDGTGLIGSTYPAYQAQVRDIATVSAAQNAVAGSFTKTYGTETDTYANTQLANGTYHRIAAENAGSNPYNIDGYYEFDIGTEGVPVEGHILGRLVEGGAPYGGDSVDIYAYNWGGTSWDHISPPTGDFIGSASSTDVVKLFTLLTTHVGTGANDGKVRIRVAGTNLESGTELYIDQIIISYTNALSVAGVWASATRTLTAIDEDSTTLDIDTAVAAAGVALADALLDRNLGTGSDSGGRTVRNALRPAVNRIVSSGGTLTVYKEDDTTSAWTAAITTDAGALPIVEVNPA